MKSLFSKAVGLALLALAPAAGPANSQETETPAKPRRQLVNRIVATVNGDLITLNELMVKLSPIQKALEAQLPNKGPVYEEQLEKYTATILQNLIDQKIIYTEFKDRISAISDQQVEEEVKRIVENVYNGDEQLFRDYLRENNLSRDQFKEQQRKEILVQAVKSQHYGDIAVPKEAELRAEYERWKTTNRDQTKDVATFRRILLDKKDARGRTTEAHVKSQAILAQQLLERVVKGGVKGDFATNAKKYSQGRNKALGGLWENQARTDVSLALGRFLFETEGNEMIGVIRPLFDENGKKQIGLLEEREGFSIIQLVERTLGPVEPYEKVRDEMIRSVTAEKRGMNLEKWMKKMRSRAIIKKML